MLSLLTSRKSASPALFFTNWYCLFAPQFKKAQDGSVAIVFALTAMIVLSLTGGAVDYGRWLSARTKTQDTIDAAVLAGGRALQTNGGDAVAAIAAANAYYAEMKSTDTINDTINFTTNNGNTSVVAVGNAYIKTPFLSLAGITEIAILDLSTSTHATSDIATGANSGTNLEISLILDVTGSMCSGLTKPCSSSPKLSPLKDAANDLIDIVVWNDQSSYTSKVAIIPYSMGVNAGAYADTARGVSNGNCT